MKPSSRDQRFVAVHRGGQLDQVRHRLLASWAADCGEHVMPLLQRVSTDPRCEEAISVGRAWSRGEVPVGEAQKASVACHALARELGDPAAVAAVRACGHAVATAHFADHSLRAAMYALRAVESPEEEYAWQLACLPDEVRELLTDRMARCFPEKLRKPEVK